MKPKLIHKEAMDFSFKAKQALEAGDHTLAFDLYKKAADMESQVAEFYFDKVELEPTRSILIRSAAFLNLKAGQIESAQKFIFFGLLNTKDELIRSQLNNALEISLSLKNLPSETASSEFNYLTILRQRSVHYVIEPSNLVFGHSVSLEMIKSFTEDFLKSLKSYAIANFKKILATEDDIDRSVSRNLEKLINPLVTNSSYGSFKFSIANDFLKRDGEKKEISQFKSNIIPRYHSEIFTNPLTNKDIEKIKEKYSEDDINDIFRPLTKLKSNNSPFKVGYYDSDNFTKTYTRRIVNEQRKQLLTTKQFTPQDIGELENSIVHKRSSQSGKVVKKTILKEQLKSYEADIKINQIEPKDHASIMLSEDIFITMTFASDKGFTFSFDDFRVEYTDIAYEKAQIGFHDAFYKKLIMLANTNDLNEEEQKDWDAVRGLIGNTQTLKKI